MHNVTTKRSKDVRINLKTNEQLRREFAIAAELRGLTMSGLLHQFIVATVWEEKEKHPEAFAEIATTQRHPQSPEEFMEILRTSGSYTDKSGRTYRLLDEEPAESDEVLQNSS